MENLINLTLNTTKICRTCGVEKDLINFTKRADRSDGYNIHCKTCNNKSRAIKRKKEGIKTRDEQKKERLEKINNVLTNNAKICSECGFEKELINFYKDKKVADGYCSRCTDCENMRTSEYYEKNRDKISVKSHNRYIENIEKYKIRSDIYYKNNPYKKRKKNITWYKNNRLKRNLYVKRKYKTDTIFKLKTNIRNLIRISFKNKSYKKSKNAVAILGCEFEQFKIYIENQFDEFMTWENYGSYWEYDHLEPLSRARNEKEVIALNHFTNIRPFEKKANIAKSDNYIETPNSIIKLSEPPLI